jgi:hypothetical protein
MAQRAFEAELFAKHHYRKLLTAKSSLTPRATLPHPPTPHHGLSPLDRYEHRTTNNKICSKLTEIYKCPETAFRRYRRKSSSKGSGQSIHEQTMRQQGETISRSNVQMFERILCAKSSIAEDWKAREKSLKRYGKLTRKKSNKTANEDSLFEAYQHLLMRSRAGSAKRRPKSSRPRQSSSASSSNRESLRKETM